MIKSAFQSVIANPSRGLTQVLSVSSPVLMIATAPKFTKGDILLCKGKYLYQVEWLTDGFMLRGKTYGGITSIKSFLPNKREVVGNIFDNPELFERR